MVRKQKLASTPRAIDSITPAIQDLERAIQWGYSLTGDSMGSIPVTVVIQTRGQKKACMGHFAGESWTGKDGKPRHEISFSSEYLLLPVVDIIGIALHETAHLWNFDSGIKDCAGNDRHNAKFKETADLFRLTCEKDGRRGWAITGLTPELEKLILEDFKPNFEAFNKARKQIESKPAKKAKSTRQWFCKCESISANATKKDEETGKIVDNNLNKFCYDCNEFLILKS